MKTKALAISMMLTFATGALFANNSENNLLSKKNLDTIPTRKDTIPKTDSVPRKKDSTVSLNLNANTNNATVFNFSNRDTVPSPKDTIPKKDSALSLNLDASANATAFNFSNRDTVPNPKDSVPKKDSALSLNLNSSANATAFNFSNRDTVPSPKDSIPKKDSTAKNLSSNLIFHSAIAGNSRNYSGLKNPIKKDEPVSTGVLALEIYKTM